MKNFTNKDGRVVRLNNKAAAEVMQAWEAWKGTPFNPYIPGRCTRALYNDANERGRKLIEIQTKYNVWMIHPANAVAGLRSDDPRILD